MISFIGFIVALISSVICRSLAQSKNRPVLFWTILGFVGGIITVIVLVFLPRKKSAIEIATDGEILQLQASGKNAPLLAVRDVSVVFGGIVALNGVSFDMHEGQILGLIGPNGAGKTTLFNCLSRLYQPSSGDILMDGASILTRPPHRIAEIGIGRTFQNVALFPNLSVLDNVRVGPHARTSSGPIWDSLRLAWVRRGEANTNKKVHEILAYLDLDSV